MPLAKITAETTGVFRMKTAGVIGIGDMGSGLAKNLIKHGYQVAGVDLKQDRMKVFTAMGGVAASTPAEVGQASDAVFVMVMTGDAESVLRDFLCSFSHICWSSFLFKPSEF